jgi:hypothetical protein
LNNFSNDSVNTTPSAPFKKYHVYEVATSLTDSKHIAEDYANANRYQHRASVMVVGNPDLKPYDPIYLDGLPNGLSGFWTVLSIKHVFGSKPTTYMMELEVGADTLGDIDEAMKSRLDVRDIQADLANQSLIAVDTLLQNNPTSVNGSSLYPDAGLVAPTAAVTTSPSEIPYVEGATDTTPPDFSSVSRTLQWAAKGSGRVVQ